MWYCGGAAQGGTAPCDLQTTSKLTFTQPCTCVTPGISLSICICSSKQAVSACTCAMTSLSLLFLVAIACNFATCCLRPSILSCSSMRVASLRGMSYQLASSQPPCSKICAYDSATDQKAVCTKWEEQTGRGHATLSAYAHTFWEGTGLRMRWENARGTEGKFTL